MTIKDSLFNEITSRGGGGLTDRQKGDRTNTSENNMFPIYDIDILNLNVLSI